MIIRRYHENFKLSDRNIDAIKAPTRTGKPELRWDSVIKGFGVRASGKSNVKTFVVQTRVNGKPVRTTLGRVGVMTFDDAKQAAKEVLAGAGRGVDPRKKKNVVATMTLSEACDAYLLAHDLSPRTKEGYADIIKRYFSDWADDPLVGITREMAESRHRSIAVDVEKKYKARAERDHRVWLTKADRAERRWPQTAAAHRANADAAKARKINTGKAAANGAMQVLRALYNYALDRSPELPPNPVRLRRQWHKVLPREKIVTHDQMPKFYRAIMNLELPVGRDYLLLVLFTGLRRREATGLRWAEMDLTAKTMSIPAARNKSGRKLDLPLTDFVHDLLVARRAIGRTEFIFSADSKSGHIEAPRHHLKEVAAECGIQVSVHDLRRTYLTIAESCEISPMALKALANHSQGSDITARYVQMNVDRLRIPAQKVTDRLKELCEIASPSGVTRLRG